MISEKYYEVSTLDKYEYKVRSEEIRTLVAEGEYAEAVLVMLLYRL